MTSEVLQYSESHCRAPKPTVMEMTRVAVVQKQQKKKQNKKTPTCTVWTLCIVKTETVEKKKKEEKKAPRCSKNSLVASPLFEHENRNLPCFLIILVARCYCRFKDLFLDGRSGG